MGLIQAFVSQSIKASLPTKIFPGPERGENPWLTEFVCLKDV